MPIKERLQIKLFPDWVDYTENNNGSLTYIKSSCKTINLLQITYSLYKSGNIPNPSFDDLINMCKDFGIKYQYDNCLGTCHGECIFGKYASSIFKTNERPWYQIWHLSNGKDFIFVTYICESEPTESELEEAFEIVMNLNLKFEYVAWWKFW